MGERLLVLPFGGRVLGLYPRPGLNVLWTNPALCAAGTAGTLLADSGWINSGGVRAWISPEFETHVRDPRRFPETYEVPHAVDPAAYEVLHADQQSVTLATAMTPMFHQSGCRVPLHLERRVSRLDEAGTDVPREVSHAGVAIDSTLAADGDLPDEVRPGLWTLLQLPGGGEFILPIRAGAEPAALIGEPVYTIEKDRLRCRVETDASFKFSLRADDCLGRMACIHRDGDHPALVTCRFPVREQSLYADAPCADLSDTGHVQQVYVDDGGFGGFGELEYHAPALEAGTRETVTDSSEIHAFTGPVEALDDLVESMLRP